VVLWIALALYLALTFWHELNLSGQAKKGTAG
jgi:hypothetical protein